MNVHTDLAFWRDLAWPAAPNSHDYDVYASYCKGRILLLGSTKMLLPLCDQAWDLEPKYAHDKIQHKDWFTIDKHWDTIMLDGGLALGKQFCEKLLPIVLSHCDRFVVRAFLNPNWPTKYAVYFPRAHELTPQPHEHPINEVYTFYIWNRNTQY